MVILKMKNIKSILIHKKEKENFNLKNIKLWKK